MKASGKKGRGWKLPNICPDTFGQLSRLLTSGQAHHDLPLPILVEKALERREGVLTTSGALRVTTGKYTGRSPDDKFVVEQPATTASVWWGPNRPLSAAGYQHLWGRLLAYLQNRELFVFHGAVGASPAYGLPVRVITELAWQNLFARQLFLRPGPQARAGRDYRSGITVISAPGFAADPEIDGTNSEAFIVLDLEKRTIIISGTQYAGEIKKSVFTLMNYLLPGHGVLPMHCSANQGEAGDVALFFGLSGTGKTTLSADPQRSLIGDDEHAWDSDGVFNLEGGCYAKCIRLSRENEPQIWEAIRFGSVLENVALRDGTREPDYDSDALTENTRAAYPVDFIPGALIPGTGGHPRTIIFLTADAFGVLPPIARLSEEQAMYHFLAGYTSKLAGTERGVTAPQATFSTCFAAPFLPRPPHVYARLLGKKIREHRVNVFLVNTGWTGGAYGTGHRLPLPYTRAMVRAAIAGHLDGVEYDYDPVFNLAIPNTCPEVPAEILKPWQAWTDRQAYQRQARELTRRFAANAEKFTGIAPETLLAGPKAG
ncbi:MAG: phosphoenolpyruvate carboxykinase (ATP) [Clostridia bacterium]|nr:MAG: phosphoenolpyruvate carboxykinase (ATP) [Clostridia bacterium]